jgi:hypothetical protein
LRQDVDEERIFFDAEEEQTDYSPRSIENLSLMESASEPILTTTEPPEISADCSCPPSSNLDPQLGISSDLVA